MSISSVLGLSAPQAASPVVTTTAAGPYTGAVSYGVGSGAAGGYVAQGSSTGSLVKKVLGGAVVGAGVGFAASFFSLPVIGQVGAPIAAAVGAGVGAVGGLVWHVLSRRKANLAMEQQAAQQQQLMATQQPVTVTPPATGTTLRVGSKGGATRTLQTNLKSLGLYPYPVSGTYDKATANAVRRFELMKGVQPTGLATPDVRTAVGQDAGLVKQFLVS